LISLPGLRGGKINLTIKIFALNPNKNFKAGLFPQEILTGISPTAHREAETAKAHRG